MMLRRLILSLAFLASILVLPASAMAAAPAPAWSLKALSYPTNFVQGTTGITGIATTPPGYLLSAVNLGAAPTAGPFTITDVLPAGIVPQNAAGKYSGKAATPLACNVVGQKATCTGNEPLQPGERAEVRVAVKVVTSEFVSNEAKVTGGGAAPITVTTETAVSTEAAPFGFLDGVAGLSTAAVSADGSAQTAAGSHPYQLETDLGFPSVAALNKEILAVGGGIRDVEVDLPRGVVVNPNATPVRCTEVQLEATQCPNDAQVGLVSIIQSATGIATSFGALYNMVPAPGSAGEFGFEFAEGIYVHLRGSVRSDGEYQLSATTSDIPAKVGVQRVDVTLWGSPSEHAHDAIRGECLFDKKVSSCPVAAPNSTAFLSMPSSCGGPLTTVARADSWEAPGLFAKRSAESTDLSGVPVGVDGCNQLGFEPTIEARASTNVADSPTGLEVDLHQPQSEDYDGLANANLKGIKVTLPEGMTLNPSAANGLASCSSAQIGLTTPVGQAGPIHFDEAPQHCPDAAKIGTVEVDTPLLDHPLPGAVYVVKPFDNPFGSLLGIYLAIEDEQTGIIAKLAGRVEADPATGRLTSSFSDSPELPIEDVKLGLFNGPAAALKTPLACGTHTTTATMTPWSTPEGADVSDADSFAISTAAGGSGACPASEAQAPNGPSFEAGTVAPQAGAYSPFVLKLSRADGSQRLTGIDTTLPPGLSGKLAGIAQCSDAQIAAASARNHPEEGMIERQSPSCPLASEVGVVNVGAGAGPTPFYTQGHAYLAGPYKGAPLSLVTITPAIAGPFDLGTVVVRIALQVDPLSARIHAVSDPLPTILDGIPLDVRSVALRMDRPDFTLNPTSCDPMAITANAVSSLGQSAALSTPFQVGGCSSLAFKPELKLSFKGGTTRAKHPALSTVLTYPKQGPYANIAKAVVTLPHAEIIDQNHVGNPCTRPQFAEEKCPAISVLGRAKAWTPLLDQPLEGNVYFRANGGERTLPDIVADLRGQIHVELIGAVDTATPKTNARIRTTFFAVPDAPVSRFELQLKGGKEGLLVNSANICRAPRRATVSFDGQNGKAFDANPVIASRCKGKAGKRKHR